MAIILDSELKSKKIKVVYALIYAFLAVFALVQFMPLYWMLIGTFKTNIELQSAIPTIIPTTVGMAIIIGPPIAHNPATKLKRGIIKINKEVSIRHSQIVFSFFSDM